MAQSLSCLLCHCSSPVEFGPRHKSAIFNKSFILFSSQARNQERIIESFIQQDFTDSLTDSDACGILHYVLASFEANLLNPGLLTVPSYIFKALRNKLTIEVGHSDHVFDQFKILQRLPLGIPYQIPWYIIQSLADLDPTFYFYPVSSHTLLHL